MASPASGKVWIFYADGKKDERWLTALRSGSPTSWGANRNAREGDLALVYVTGPASEIGFVAKTIDDAVEGEERDYEIQVQLLGALSPPLKLDLLQRHPALENWSFASSQQGATRWVHDIRAQGFWEPLRGLIVCMNPELAIPLAEWEGLTVLNLATDARKFAEQIPDDGERQAALERLEDLVRTVPSTPSDEARAAFQAEPKVARDYWTIEDRLGARPHAEAIAAFIRHKDTEPPLTIGIKAPWGAGKTSLMRMVQAALDPPVDPRAPVWKFRDLNLTQSAFAQLAKTTSASGDPKPSPAPEPQSGPVKVGTALERLREAPQTPPQLDTVEASEVALDDRQGWRATVWFNPWMYQTGEEVWAGFAHEIIEQVTGRLPLAHQERFWLELNLRRVDRQAIRRRIYTVALEKVAPALLAWLVLTAVAAIGGIDPLGVGLGSMLGLTAIVTLGRVMVSRQKVSDAVSSLVRAPDLPSLQEGLRGSMEGAVDEIVRDPAYRSKAGFLHFVQTDIRHVLDLVATRERPLVIFVDDLDRCSPGVVSQTIEAINLFLAGQFPNVIFVLALEPAVVAAHVEVAHKDLVERLKADRLNTNWSTLGWRFLEKIVQLPLNLPQPSRRQATDYLTSLFAGDGAGPGNVFSPEREQQVKDLTERAVKAVGNAGLEELPRRLAEIEETIPPAERAIVAAEARRRVMAQVFEQFFKDSDPLVQEIIRKQAMQLPNLNAREIKRLLNLFRFYAFIAARNRILDLASSESQRATLEKVARLAVLAIRWPYLLNVVARAGTVEPDVVQEERPPILLEDLERAADGNEAWEAVLLRVGLASKDGSPPTFRADSWADELREFCRGEPKIGRFSRDFV